ncbi:MAG TPA: succinyldiaminopimelate transaminase [Gammaproteobacteria bacterium]|nr:succinyldiaminopimelate transaminase [Gammaproteobacteria bacterium]
MNPDLEKLQPYPFEKLAQLKASCQPPHDLKHIALSIGEPKHSTPDFISSEFTKNIGSLTNYPLTRGTDELRAAITEWLCNRFNLPEKSLDLNKNIIPVNGTREALFAFAQCLIDRKKDPLVLMPNPFYQIYEGAATLSGATIWFINATRETGYLPDFSQVPDEIWQQCQLLYICSPGNPTGAVIDTPALQNLIGLADKHDFVIASDECYSELYSDEKSPPPGLLGAAAAMGRTDYSRCIVFHSLSKRSNAPGLRSGFVAGDAAIIRQFLLFRTYHGCAMPLPTQMASLQAWKDESHVVKNRRLYREKFKAVAKILSPVISLELPPAGFYLWIKTPISDTEFSRRLFNRQNVTVLPGTFLSRNAHGVNPGENRVRIALVADLDECIEAAYRIKAFIVSL